MSTVRYDFQSNCIHAEVESAKLLYISTSKYGGDWFSAPHIHGCTEIFYVTGGKGDFFVCDDSFRIGAEDMIIVNPNVVHTEKGFSSDPLEYIVMGIEGLVLNMADDPGGAYCVFKVGEDSRDVRFLVNEMLCEIQNRSTGFEAVCQSLLDVLLIKLLRKTNYSKAPTAERVTMHRDTAAVRQYIEGHYREPLTLDTLAQKTHFNKFHLAHTFSREFGISPVNYINKLRLKESKELLRTTDFSLAQIARTCGFASASYFSQRFRKAEGMTPTEYRLRYMAEEPR